MPKRKGKLWDTLVSDDNLGSAIFEVNKTHRWHHHHQGNQLTAWVELTARDRILELRKILEDGFVPKKPRIMKQWDFSAQKMRVISEPAQWPDQYVHHALIQVLQPALMRGMDFFCCGSVRERGTQRARIAIQSWVRNDIPGTKYCLACDIHHFYDSLKPNVVMARMKRLIKDHRVLDLIERIISDGISIGMYTSQWFANTVLQPLDVLIRQAATFRRGVRLPMCKHYVRYMDNFTIFGSNKRNLHKLRMLINQWLAAHELSMKHDWQVFPVAARLPDAVGYRYGRNFTLLRKYTFLRLKRALARWRKSKYKSARRAAGLLSRLGMLKHCSNHDIYKYIYRGTRVERELKRVIRKQAKQKEAINWSTFLAQAATKKSCVQKTASTQN